MIKVLHMTKLGAGGISTLTVNLNSLIDLTKVHFDYLVFEDENTFYEDKVKILEAEKRIVDVTKYRDKKLLLYWKKYSMTKKLLKRINYNVMHVDASTPMDVVIGVAAKHAGVKRIVLHSHIAGDNKHSVARTVYMNVCRFVMKFVFTDYIAISQNSAKFMFPKNISRKGQYTIIRNGIIAEKYKFEISMRERKRTELGIKDNEFLLGHIGRFSPEKNHSFILDTFSVFHLEHQNSKLLLIGDGPLRAEIEGFIKELGITDSVILYGTSPEVPQLLQAMDAFIFPSKHEGLGISAIEAQCSGLPTYCSEGIPEETRVTELFHRIRGFDPSIWAKQIKCNIEKDRQDRISKIKNAGFNLSATAEELQNFYITGEFTK